MAAGQGLMGLLQRRAQPAIRCFSQPVSEADQDANILLVDGGAVLQAIVDSLLPDDEQAAQKAYLHTCRFATGLKRTRLRMWVVLGGELAQELADGAKDPTNPAHVPQLAFHQALLDLSITVHWATASQHPLILDLYRKNRAKVEAVLSSDVCYFVYGVTTCSFIKDVLVDRQSTTMVFWDCQECWKKWRLAVGGRFGDLVPLERAQVAALLGVSVPTGAATLEDRSAFTVDSKKTMELLTSPSVAATMALAFDASEQLPMKFFQEVLGLNRFGAPDLEAFKRSVMEFMQMVSRVKSATGPEAAMDALPSVTPDLRAALLPDTPVPTIGDLLEPDEGSILAMEEAEGKTMSEVLVEVGSSLKQSEWNEIDDKDIISKTRYGAAFKIMQKIPAYSTETELPTIPSARIDVESVWQYLYASRKEDKAFKRVAEATFPQRWEAAKDKDSMDKKTASELKKLTQASVMEKVNSLRDVGLAKRTKAWLELLPGKDVESVLALRREAIIQGADSVAWTAAEACWSHANIRLKSAVLTTMFSCDNKAAVAGPPGRYPHQEELLKMIHEHLSREGSGGIDHNLPLQIELSTPTGSGKTFAALMVHLQLLKVHHPDAIMVYSVPTKSVLKTVGQACEAHSVVYWTAATEGDGSRFQVRRPYSIRTGKTKGDAGSGTMAGQLEANRLEGKEKRDRGNGKPDVIIADIQATAALVRSSGEEDPKSPFHSANIVLYFDEPNMGVHLNAKVRETVSTILEYSPFTTVLASATLPPWSMLQPWWRCGGKPATRATITLEPYELPQAHLEVLDELRQELRTTNLLSLFESHTEFCEVLRDNKRLQIILLRHLTPQQGLDLLGAETDTEHVGFGLLHGEVTTLREALEANLASLMDDPERYKELRSKWNKADTVKSIDARNGPAVGGVISKTGITMIATQDARKLALELAGKHDERIWGEKIHKLNADKAQAAKLHKDAEKERGRRKNDDGPDDGAITGYIRLREGIQVSLSDADGADQDELLMLQAGIAYSTAGGASPLVQRLYQQTLLSVPEKVVAQSRKLPPINVLVVDYSSIYGTDCPAVDTLVMMTDLGKALSWQDSQQFMGRLRRDGRAIFCNFDTLRRASTSIGEVQDAAPEPGTARDVSATLLQAAAKGTPAAQTLSKLDEKRRENGLTKSALGCNVAVAMFGQLLGAPEGSRGAEKKAYKSEAITAATAPAAMKAAVDKWGPLVRHLARTDEDQTQILRSLQALAEGKGEWGEAGALYMDLSARLLKLLYDEDVVSEEAVFAWEAATRKTAGDSRFLKLAGPFLTWLKEAEEDSDEEEEDDK